VSTAGEKITLTPEEEEAAIKEALHEEIVERMTAKDIREEMFLAGLSAVGNAVGLAIAGYFLSKALGKKYSR
jgi:hypothetical protein